MPKLQKIKEKIVWDFAKTIKELEDKNISKVLMHPEEYKHIAKPA